MEFIFVHDTVFNSCTTFKDYNTLACSWYKREVYWKMLQIDTMTFWEALFFFRKRCVGWYLAFCVSVNNEKQRVTASHLQRPRPSQSQGRLSGFPTKTSRGACATICGQVFWQSVSVFMCHRDRRTEGPSGSRRVCVCMCQREREDLCVYML